MSRSVSSPTELTRHHVLQWIWATGKGSVRIALTEDHGVRVEFTSEVLRKGLGRPQFEEEPGSVPDHEMSEIEWGPMNV